MTEDLLRCIREAPQEEGLIVEYTSGLDRITVLTVRDEHYISIAMGTWLDILKTEDGRVVGFQVWGFSKMVADQISSGSKHNADLLNFLVRMSKGEFDH